MSLSVHSSDADDPDLNTTINTTPLVDVMLVLLIIFLITVPVVLKQIVELPNASNIPTITKPENIVIAVDKDENIYWDNQPIDASELKGRFADLLRTAIAKGGQLPEVHIRGDKDARFEAIGRVILACQQAGIQKVGFITEPRNDVE